MAITIETDINNYSTVYNEMVTVVSSTNVAQPSFKYLFDIYIDGSVTKEARLKIPAEPDYNYGIADVHRVLESFVTSNIGDNTSTLGVTTNPDSILSYQIKYGEEYEVAGTLTQFPDLTLGSVKYAINGSLTFPDFINYDSDDYLIDSSSDKFLTNAPSFKTSINDSGWLYFLPESDINPTTIRVKTFDSSGSSLGTWEIDDSTSFSTTAERHLKVCSNPVTLNNIDNAELSVGVQPIITASTASYTIQALNDIGATISELKTFTIEEPCKYEKKRLIFLNALGGFDGFNFNLVSKDLSTVERKNYKKNPKRVTSGGGYNYSLQDREKIQYYTKSMPRIKVTSDWISEEESTWLRELFVSPEIYLEDENNNLIAMKGIMGSEYEQKKHVNGEKIFNLEYELEYSYDNYTQRG